MVKDIGILVMVIFFLILMALLPIQSCSTGTTTSDNIVTTSTSQTTESNTTTTADQLPAPGRTAPDFELQTLDGQTVSLSDYRGSPVMLNFWASWCGPCQSEMPYIQDVFEDAKWQAADLVILAVNWGESLTTARGFMNTYGFTFTVLLDSTGQVADIYNIRAIPTTFFIDERGIIKYMDIGSFRSKADLEQRLNGLIFGE
jgi:peroxiredoxin